MNLLIYIFEREITVENMTKSFEEGIMATLEIRLQQDYDTPVTPAEATEMSKILISNWKKGNLSKDKLLKILKKEKN